LNHVSLKNKKGHKFFTYGPYLSSLFSMGISHGEDAVSVTSANTTPMLPAGLPSVRSWSYIAAMAGAGQA
jgi:hypothetical protein